ncbi:hypothetical protein ABZY31_30105 [Streptomyces sp. NPDC006529]|uniref:hypothetical protein n=1 Tax=Streptomyces sp. NPDC006529 TaxID=3157177 RepID=UPI0033A4941C
MTRWRALAPALHAELEQRGYLRPWPPIPAGGQPAGQTLGGTAPHRGTGLTARLCVTLPDTLAVPLHHGVYWTNLPHLQALEAWTDRWGTDPATRRTAPPKALAERDHHAGSITTTGQIIRTALTHTLHNAHTAP